jgi:hypothetical protein
MRGLLWLWYVDLEESGFSDAYEDGFLESIKSRCSPITFDGPKHAATTRLVQDDGS